MPLNITAFFWSVFSRIWTECEPETTLYLDNFHAVYPHNQIWYRSKNFFISLTNFINSHNKFSNSLAYPFEITCWINLAKTSKSNQRWNKLDFQSFSTLFQRWYFVENESWADICLSTLFQRWNEVAFSTLIWIS